MEENAILSAKQEIALELTLKLIESDTINATANGADPVSIGKAVSALYLEILNNLTL